MSDRRSFALPGARAQYGPDRSVRVHHIDMVLHPDLNAKTLAGVVTMQVSAIDDDVRSLRLDAVDLTIEAVTGAEGTPLVFVSTSHDLTIALATPLAAGEIFSFAVRYRVEQPVRGLYFIDEPRQAWTQSQDSDARSWLPCFDYPAGKQTTSATIVVPRGQFALANGALAGRHDDGETTTFEYRQDIPHSTYLLTLAVGTFSEITQAHARLPVFYYVVPGREDDGERAFGNTPRMIDAFEATIGVPYPYARYSQIAVADFIFGGMENTAATTQTDRTLHDERAHLDFSSDPLVSHELAHQWFGDLVTCRDWSQAWLNEGFATFFETVWREADLGWDEYLYDVYEIVGRYVDEDGERYRRPIVCNVFRDPIELFDRHLYEKGGAVLHMLRGELGWERMKRSLRRYVSDNATRNVETIDLVRAIEAETGRNMRRFFAQWIERAGHPELAIGVSWDADAKTASVTVEQKQAIDADHPAFVFDLDIGFVAGIPAAIATDAGDGPLPDETRVRMHITRATETFTTPLASAPLFARIDPAAYVLCTMALDDVAPEMLIAALRGDPSPIARIRAAKALGKGRTRAGNHALAAALGSDPFWGVGVEIAALLATSRAPFARTALLAAVQHRHPKVRRAVADALGNFRDAKVADALIALRADASYFVVAAALTALGKTRDARAFDALVAALEEPSWNATIAAGAARGLAELADERVLAPLMSALERTRPEGLRRVALAALARAATLTDAIRTPVVEALDRALEDDAYLVRMAAYAAAEKLADVRLLETLDRLATTELDGRLRRDATEAAIRIREAQKMPAELTTMREELDRLRADLSALAPAADVTKA